MKKLIYIFTLFIFGLQSFSAQCTVSFTTGPANNTSYANITGQSFKPICTAKLNSITFPNISAFSDDLRASGYKVGVRIKDAQNNILAHGFWSNGNLLTDNWYPGNSITADFQCSNITLQNGTAYIWEVYEINPDDPTYELILFGVKSGNGYSDGNYIKDGVEQSTDLIGWTVNLSVSVTELSATQSHINPSGAGTDDGSASVVVSNGVPGAATTYVWKKNGAVLPNVTTSTATNLGVGNYTVDITKGCTITKSFALVEASLATDAPVENSWSLYPNPATTEINFILGKDQEIKIISADGKKAIFLPAKKGRNTVNISRLNSGIYYLKTSGSATKFMKK